MRLDQELVYRGLCKTRTEAQELIELGAVFVNNFVCLKQIKQILPTDIIEVTSRRQFVSRGGVKLQGILRDVFLTDEESAVELAGKNALDVGSSTGGFTDCLLFYGVAHVDAVDVGTLQLHEKLRSDVRVMLYENTDIRDFKTSEPYDVVVADVSFIPLTHVFDDCMRFGTQGTMYFLLIKPQFEVGKGNTKKGIVKDEELVTRVLDEYTTLAQAKGLSGVQIFPCHVAGGDGNQEYFLYGRK